MCALPLLSCTCLSLSMGRLGYRRWSGWGPKASYQSRQSRTSTGFLTAVSVSVTSHGCLCAYCALVYYQMPSQTSRSRNWRLDDMGGGPMQASPSSTAFATTSSIAVSAMVRPSLYVSTLATERAMTTLTIVPTYNASFRCKP